MQNSYFFDIRCDIPQPGAYSVYYNTQYNVYNVIYSKYCTLWLVYTSVAPSRPKYLVTVNVHYLSVICSALLASFPG